MSSAILAWFASEGVGLLLGFLAKVILDYFNERRSDQALRDAGYAEARNDALIAEREGLRQATEATNEAAIRHQTDTTDDAFDNRFRRD